MALALNQSTIRHRGISLSQPRPLRRNTVDDASARSIVHKRIRVSTRDCWHASQVVRFPRAKFRVSALLEDGTQISPRDVKDGEAIPACEVPVNGALDNESKGSFPWAQATLATVVTAFGQTLDLDGPGSVLEVLGILAGVIFFHELGHFLAARAQNITVKRFSVGIGPTVLKWQDKSGVEYALRALPLGGFVAFPDGDPENGPPKDDPDLLRNRPIGDRVVVISMGVIFNAILAYAVLLTQVTTQGVPERTLVPGVSIPEVLQGSPAMVGGLRGGDVVIAVNGEMLGAGRQAVMRLVGIVQESGSAPVNMSVLRDGTVTELTVRPSAQDDNVKIGAQLSPVAQKTLRKATGPVDALSLAGTEFWRMTSGVVGALQRLASNFRDSSQQLSGPVAIVAAGAELARTEPSSLFSFTALLNINLAVVNLLPLPTLDGGFLALLLLEAARGKKLDEGLEKVCVSYSARSP
eukprot:jgi/Mesvir1/15663/Mv03265-RA.3